MSESALPTAALPATAVPAHELVDPEVRVRIRRGIEDILPRVLGVELADIPANACFFDDFGLTSSGIVELVLDIEEQLAIQVDVEHLAIDDIRTVDSLTDYVVGHHVDED
ncbi:acyl carrier protein [Kitasatospora sp. CB01950]|uniref:acyl carrier protein n=1 Tax=Kitasatospora sp. CB01950 TaxID=1703930 RepID=UPI0009F83FA6|nr:acyl carrier protein [Kitasatospora sp. CB01950]